MDESIKEQIFNILKNNDMDPSKFKFVGLNKTFYKIYYNNIFVTYIEITNNNNNNSSQALNWKCYRDKFIDYIRKLEKFDFDVVCLINIIDTKILDKCINSLKSQTNEVYIELIVSSHDEIKYAIDHNVEFFWTTEKIIYQRLSSAVKSIKNTIRFIKNIMICNSNDIFINNWINEGVKLIRDKQYDIAGSEKQYLIDMENSYMYKRVIDQSYAKQTIGIDPWINIYWHNGMIMNKTILAKINWELYSQHFLNNITYGIFDKLLKMGAKLGSIDGSDMVSVFTEKSIININDYIFNKSNIIESLTELPILNRPPLTELNIKFKQITNKKVLPKMPEKKMMLP